jgi:hypothetical protein
VLGLSGLRIPPQLNEFFRLRCCYAAHGDLVPTFREYISFPNLRVKQLSESKVLGPLDP